MTERADLVVGAGTIGGWAAWFAKTDGAGRVVVLEQGLVGGMMWGPRVSRVAAPGDALAAACTAAAARGDDRKVEAGDRQCD